MVLIFVLGLASSAIGVLLPAEGLKIDVQSDSGQPTLTGWEKWNTTLDTDGGPPANLTVSGITFVMSGDKLCVRDYAGGDNVMTDGAFSDEHPGSGGEKVRVTVTGLDDGTYAVKTLHSWLFDQLQYLDIFSNTTQVADELEFTKSGTVDTAVNCEFELTGESGVTGACCLGNENCEDGLTEAECVVAPYNGRFMGEDSECASVDCSASGCACQGDLNDDEQVDLEDLQAVAGILLQAGSPFIVPVEPGHCGNMNDDLQIDLEDLQAVAGILLQAGSPFIVQCD